MAQLLFLCTGNYYRSRFAEIYFNALTVRDDIGWKATSRGLKIGWPGNVGPLSEHTEKRLKHLGIDFSDFLHMPIECRATDLSASDLTIALKEAEHRPMLAEKFSGWENRVTYWHVHDVQDADPTDALAEIERLVADLVRQLKRNDRHNGNVR